MPPGSVTRFTEVRGHQRVRDFLRTAATNDRLPHALLFAGAEGVGKRTIALALAAWILCEEDGDDACGRCSACRQVAVLSHPDFQLVGVAAGKKEIGVDRARDVKHFTQLRPLRGTMKVAVIDEAPMLTVAAQNALLKTLEEPPAHSLLILIANNPDALLPTVRSRCQRVQFSPLSNDIVVDILVQDHGINAAAALQLATLAEGSPGRALALSRSVGGTDALPQLAGISGARYVELMHLANTLGLPESDTAMKLEILLSQLRDDMLRALGAAHLAPSDTTTPTPTRAPSVRAMLIAADLVHGTREAMRRGNPNRQLLLEALLLRLARSE